MKKWTKNKDGLFVTTCVDCKKDKLTKKRPYEGTGRCLSCAAKISIDKKRDALYSTERNEKVSKGQKKRWSKVGKSERSDLIKNWMSDYLGSEKHLKIALENQKKATVAALNLSGMSVPEVEFAEFLQELGVDYEPQFFVEQFPFDFYLPDTEQLVEIDGEFWHPLTETEATYPAQKHNFERDKRKNKVAEEHGFKLTRLRVPKS